MTQEQKAKAYDKAIDRARYWAKCPTVWNSDDICQKIFPELVESEENRIKRCIGMALTDVSEQRFTDYDTSLRDCLAWLEKQRYSEFELENEYWRGYDDAKFHLKEDKVTVIGAGSNSASVSDGDNSVTSKEVVSQQTGWSKEDTDFKTKSVRYLCNLRDTFEENKWDTKPIQRCINWLLEFPKPQSYWKPSKEQMKALYDSIPEKVMEISEREVLLNELYKDLLKL